MTVTKPSWTWIGTNGINIWKGTGKKKLAVVCHIMQGSLGACDSWFSNPAAQASANFGVGATGAIHCYVDPTSKDSPYANGLINGPDAAVQAIVAANPGVNMNDVTVSIEHEGFSGTPLTALQLEASGHLAAWLCDTFGILADENHLLGHYEFDSVTRAGCPGWDRTGWLAWEAVIHRYLVPQPTPTPIPTPPNLTDAQAQFNAIISAAEKGLADISTAAIEARGSSPWQGAAGKS